eukprot:Polyplicarium_translucidae@DN2971_c0_g1_i1.p1
MRHHPCPNACAMTQCPNARAMIPCPKQGMTLVVQLAHLVRLVSEIELHGAGLRRIADQCTVEAECGSQEELATPRLPPALLPARSLDRFTGCVSIRGLTVRYAGRETPALDRVDLEIAAGEAVTILGRTGAGKSTLFSAMLRLVEPSAGLILFDGEDIRRYSSDAVRAVCAVIPQDPAMFTGSVAFNLDPTEAVARPRLWEALDAVNMGGFVGRLPGQLDAELDPDSLSLGERQLLCVARALVRNPRLLLLDEVTSLVDASTASSFMECLRAHSPHTTMISISHRPAAALCDDAVVILDGGRVIERGNPITLRDTLSEYARLMECAGS